MSNKNKDIGPVGLPVHGMDKHDSSVNSSANYTALSTLFTTLTGSLTTVTGSYSTFKDTTYPAYTGSVATVTGSLTPTHGQSMHDHTVTFQTLAAVPVVINSGSTEYVGFAAYTGSNESGSGLYLSRIGTVKNLRVYVIQNSITGSLTITLRTGSSTTVPGSSPLMITTTGSASTGSVGLLSDLTDIVTVGSGSYVNLMYVGTGTTGSALISTATAEYWN